ncbi:inosine triphosphate pyrophosphatase-like protein [Xylariaceae sp. FL1272]|nr:inosine triphosphate pyrophosphatase-like protein [Xylariaceae sp. FL1272]
MEKSQPLASSEVPKEPPPDYDTSAREHGPLPIRTAPPQGRRPPPIAPLDLPIVQYMKTHRVILASASPRRRQLLGQIGLTNIEVKPSTKPENLPKEALGAFEYVSATAAQKALDIYQTELATTEAAAEANGDDADTPQKDPDLVIAADTVIVTRDGKILEKPASEQAHKRMLRHLRDTRIHRVLTAVCCIAPKADASFPGYSMVSHTEETKVTFAKELDGLPDEVIDAYVKTREGVDKAGGYAVQGIGGSLLIEKIEGGVDNVIGLPVRKTLQLCEKVIFKQEEESDEEEEEDIIGF